MSFFSTDNPCPCESGLDYLYCCGSPDRTELNVVARVAQGNEKQLEPLNEHIRQTLADIRNDPDWFPAKLNLFQNKVQLVKMSPFWYTESVFLDANRILGTYAVEAGLEWLKEKTEGIAWQHSPYIFHTAFCGSTIMSKALSVIYDSLPLREPEVLGALMVYTQAEAVKREQAQDWYQRVLSLLARRYEPEQIGVVKANDNANALMVPLLDWRNDIPVLFMYPPVREFLVGCLKADNRRQWIQERYHFAMRTARNVLDLPQDFALEEGEYGKMAALYWSYNIALYYQAWELSNGGIKSLDFNLMLADPLASVKACADYFKLKQVPGIVPESEIRILFSVYSKDGAQSYGPNQRGNEIDKVLSNNPRHLEEAEQLAHQLLGDKYPHKHLPGCLLS